VLHRLRELPKSERAECLLVLCELAEGFGRPHAHSGLGIRKLGNKLFERRAGLALRCIFQDRPADLFVSFRGNHDENETVAVCQEISFDLTSYDLGWASLQKNC
jgi:hypothetical protein